MEISSKDCTPKDLYKLLSGIIVPRPIAFVSTKSADGIDNVAPFSFFNVVSSDPPIVMFSIGVRNGEKKDTLKNIENNEEFIVNLVNEKIAQAMHNSGADFRPEVSEFDEIGLTRVAATKIHCMSVKESPIQLECKLEQVIPVGKNYMVLGRVVHFRIDDHLYIDPFKIDIAKFNPIGRLAGKSYSYTKDVFELERNVDQGKLIKKK
ncbi:flavin reductase family protein [Anaerobacillus sp. MEB173]|uniref:flavin reductase family protein n=1 Tax=Anaerobacillus sp. MEB173 TaxID=3383345 RepID=UPI003F911098